MTLMCTGSSDKTKRYINPFCFGCFFWLLSKLLLTILNLFSGFIFWLLVGLFVESFISSNAGMENVVNNVMFCCRSERVCSKLPQLVSILMTRFGVPTLSDCEVHVKKASLLILVSSIWISTIPQGGDELNSNLCGSCISQVLSSLRIQTFIWRFTPDFGQIVAFIYTHRQELMKSRQSRDIMATFWVWWSDAF